MDLSLATRPGRGCVVVQVSGALDLATTPDLRNSLQQALDGGAQAMVLDLTGVPFIDSTALGTIVWLHKQLAERGGRVCIAAAKPVVLRVFELTAVDRLIHIHRTVQAAEDDLSSGDGH